MRRALTTLAALLAVSPTYAYAEGQTVRDTHASFLDVSARQKELRMATSSRVKDAVAHLDSCLKLPAVDAPQGRMIIPRHYLTGSDGPINPAEHEATAPYNSFERRITAGMNRYLATGDLKEAACAQQQIHQWAQANELLDYDPKESSQAWYQVEWTLSSIAVTESVLVNNSTLDPTMLQQDKAWLNRVAHRMIDFEVTHPAHNNHHAWRALGAVATGVVTGDDKLFQWGITVFHEEVDQIDARGAFPLEMQRKENSIHYQAFALQPLIPIAEFAERQKIDLYAYISASGKTIRDAVRFLTDVVANPDIVKVYTDVPQKLRPLPRDFYCFGEFYVHRFPTLPESVAMKTDMQEPTYASRIGGSTTVLAGEPR
ncbi:alginate lyase family protein [Terriglobus sp. RCC_193]|uniref:alginate lyase family protein n=1 Tax=Terriglobus sp. RCC_193 TaxID=3239218 RepID=UPI0035240253